MASNAPAISAHARGGPIEAYRAAVATGADYVELDIRRTADGDLVAFHDPRTAREHLVAAVGHARLGQLAGYAVPTVADVLAAIRGRAKGHLDLKETGGEEELVRLALGVLGPGGFIITTAADASVAAIRARFPDRDAVPVALSVRPGVPLRRLAACGAEWAAVDHRLAVAGAVRRCRRRDVKIMVWTVNREPEIRYWLARRRTDVLVTDRPALAVALRDRVRPPR